jgi:hypothetical protein
MVAGFAAATLLFAAVPAGASDDTFAATADAGGLSLSIAGNAVLDLATTSAAVTPGEAAAVAIPGAVAGEGIGDLEAISSGPVVAEEACAGAIPAPLSSIIALEGFCGEVVADGSGPQASATAGVLGAGVLDLGTAELGELQALLTQLGLADLLTQVSSPIVDDLLGTLAAEAGDQCLAVLGTDLDGLLLSDLDGLDGLVGALPGAEELLTDPGATLGDLVGTIGGTLGLASAQSASLVQAAAVDLALLDGLLDLLDDLDDSIVPTVCGLLQDLVDLLDGTLLTVTTADLSAALGDLTGVATVQLLETISEAGADGDEVAAFAGPTGAASVTVDLPLLDEVLGDLLDDLLGELLGSLDGALTPVLTALPLPNELTVVVDQLTAQILDTGALAGLLDGPLLDVTVTPGAAEVVYTASAAEFEATASAVLVELDGAVFSLPVLDELDGLLDTVARELDSNLLAALRDTPLVDVVSVTLLQESIDEDADVLALPGVEATSGAALVTILGAAEGGIALDVATAAAAVGAGVVAPGDGPGDDDDVTTAGPDPDPAAPSGKDPLPVTGGGAAMLGLAAIGAAAALRRRG